MIQEKIWFALSETTTKRRITVKSTGAGVPGLGLESYS